MFKAFVLGCFLAFVAPTLAGDKDKNENGSIIPGVGHFGLPSGIPGLGGSSALGSNSSSSRFPNFPSSIPGLGGSSSSGSSSGSGSGFGIFKDIPGVGGSSSSSSSSAASGAGGLPIPGIEQAALAGNALQLFSDPCTIKTMRGFINLANQAQGLQNGGSGESILPSNSNESTGSN